MSHLRAYRSAGGRYVPLFHSVKRGDAVALNLDSLRVINRNQKRSIRVLGLDGSVVPTRMQAVNCTTRAHWGRANQPRQTARACPSRERRSGSSPQSRRAIPAHVGPCSLKTRRSASSTTSSPPNPATSRSTPTPPTSPPASCTAGHSRGSKATSCERRAAGRRARARAAAAARAASPGRQARNSATAALANKGPAQALTAPGEPTPPARISCAAARTACLAAACARPAWDICCASTACCRPSRRCTPAGSKEPDESSCDKSLCVASAAPPACRDLACDPPAASCHCGVSVRRIPAALVQSRCDEALAAARLRRTRVAADAPMSNSPTAVAAEPTVTPDLSPLSRQYGDQLPGAASPPPVSGPPECNTGMVRITGPHPPRPRPQTHSAGCRPSLA